MGRYGRLSPATKRICRTRGRKAHTRGRSPPHAAEGSSGRQAAQLLGCGDIGGFLRVVVNVEPFTPKPDLDPPTFDGLTADQGPSDPGLEFPLQIALDRSCSIDRVESLPCHKSPGFRREIQADPAVTQAHPEIFGQQINY